MLGLFVTLGFEWLLVFALRRAGSLPEVESLLQSLRKLPLLALGSLALVLVSGGYMASRTALWGSAWMQASLASLVLIAPLGVIAGRQMRAIRADVAAG